MEEALLDAPLNNQLCGSVGELQDRLRHLLSTKVSETRAEHISASFELPSTATFTITVAENENEALESAANIDPLLGGARTVGAPTAENDQPARHISASDTLINQPQNDPVLQRTVAKHIVTAFGEVDQANWVVRQVSRVDQGWTFTYICKDSSKSWTRQNAKHAARAVGGDSQDLVNMGRSCHVLALIHSFFLLTRLI
jgi:hypothetical protein